jgi:hypothetical protein
MFIKLLHIDEISILKLTEKEAKNTGLAEV